MSSKKSKFLEESLQQDMHPFAARLNSPSPPPQQLAEGQAINMNTSSTPRTGRTGWKRTMIRHAFDIYLDQLEQLRGLSADDRRVGEIGSMSAMVREAIQDYLSKRSRE